MERFDIAIIGTGPAGISAAITGKIRNKSVLLLGSKTLSEKISKSHGIKNYPGLPDITGPELREHLTDHLDRLGIEITEDRINAVYAMGGHFVLKGNGNSTYEAKAVILATGVDFGKPLEGEKEFLGRGVSYCATCDGFFYKGKVAAVLGWSEEAEKDAEFLSEICSEVKYFKLYREGLKTAFPENVYVSEEIPVAVEGGMKAEKILLKNGNEVSCDGVFILRKAISPEQLVPGLETEDNHIKTDRRMRTNLEGCFACGDAAGSPYQYIKAAGEGNSAVLAAVEWLAEKKGSLHD